MAVLVAFIDGGGQSPELGQGQMQTDDDSAEIADNEPISREIPMINKC